MSRLLSFSGSPNENSLLGIMHSSHHGAYTPEQLDQAATYIS